MLSCSRRGRDESGNQRVVTVTVAESTMTFSSLMNCPQASRGASWAGPGGPDGKIRRKLNIPRESSKMFAVSRPNCTFRTRMRRSSRSRGSYSIRRLAPATKSESFSSRISTVSIVMPVKIDPLMRPIYREPWIPRFTRSTAKFTSFAVPHSDWVSVATPATMIRIMLIMIAAKARKMRRRRLISERLPDRELERQAVPEARTEARDVGRRAIAFVNLPGGLAILGHPDA